MTTTDFVATVANGVGNDGLLGAIVLVAMERPIDQLTRLLSVGPSLASPDPGTTSEQIESSQAARYTAAVARVLDYRVRPAIR